MKQSIPISAILADKALQCRQNGTVQTVVRDYAKALKRKAKFPPVDVFYDGSIYHLADGFHRYESHLLAGLEYIDANVREGTKRDAMLFAVGANRDHGLKRTAADKRHAVTVLLRDPEWSKCNDSWIADAAHVSRAHVWRTRATLGIAKPEKVATRNGRVVNSRHEFKGGRDYMFSDDTFARLATYVANHQSYSREDACNALDITPKTLDALVIEAAKRDIVVAFKSTRDELKDYSAKLRERELRDAKNELLEQLRQRDFQLETMMALKADPIEPIVARKGIGEGKRRQGVPCMVLSDLHIEERVTLEKTMGLNEYNLDIADKCLDRCAEAFEWFEKEKKPLWDMRTAIVAIIGDTISGWIHAELVESNFLSPIKAAVWIGERLERVLKTILATTNFERIIVVLKDGNHGRLTQKIRCSTRTENSLEWYMFHHLAARFQDEPRLQFKLDDAPYSYLDVFGKTIAFTHGDQWQYMGGVGGLLIPVRRGVNEARKFRHFDTVVMGHFHDYMPLEDIHVNGALIGVTPYSISKSIPPRRRCQSWFMLDSRNWKTANCPVWLVREPDGVWNSRDLPIFDENGGQP